MPLTRKPSAAPAAAPADPAVTLGKLVSGSEEDRWAAARSAVDIPGAAQALRSALAEERIPRVREAMFTSLARINTAESAEAILPFIRSDDSSMRTGALDALGMMKAVARPYLPALLKDPDPDVRILSCELARGMPGQDTIQLLCDLLDTDADSNVCAAAVEVLSEIGASDALAALERCRNRFSAVPFLVFSINAAADRLRPAQTPPRG